MNILEKINNHLIEQELDKILNELDEVINELDEIENDLDNFELLDESRKSQLVAKLIGLGYMEKTKDGKLKVIKNISREDLYKNLKKREKVKKIGRTIKKASGYDSALKVTRVIKKVHDKASELVLGKERKKRIDKANKKIEDKTNKIARKIKGKMTGVISKVI